MKGLGNRIRDLRLARGLTQQALAEKVGVDDTYISKIERDVLPYPPSTATLQRLAQVLGGDALDFMALAKRAPTGFESLTGAPAAREFLRAASEMPLAEKDWMELTAFLNRRRKRKGRSP
jgi:transcriptional regulator with XRE-family HTH domain